MKTMDYYVLATYTENLEHRSSESVLVHGEEQLEAIINEFVNRKLKKLKIQIRRLINGIPQKGWDV